VGAAARQEGRPRPQPAELIGKLPGIGDLPDWLKGTGKYVLSHVGDWIKDNVAKLIPGGGGGTKGPKGVGTFNGIPMADWVIDSLNYGRKHGAYGNPTSGYRPAMTRTPRRARASIRARSTRTALSTSAAITTRGRSRRR
jgi:hypothetical protein